MARHSFGPNNGSVSDIVDKYNAILEDWLEKHVALKIMSGHHSSQQCPDGEMKGWKAVEKNKAYNAQRYLQRVQN